MLALHYTLSSYFCGLDIPWQCSPFQPATQRHLKVLLSISIHVPSCRHGLEAHISLTVKKRRKYVFFLIHNFLFYFGKSDNFIELLYTANFQRCSSHFWPCRKLTVTRDMIRFCGGILYHIHFGILVIQASNLTWEYFRPNLSQ